MTPSSSHGAAAPLMGTAGVRNLFFPAIDEESEGGELDAEPPSARFAQLAVSGRLTPPLLHCPATALQKPDKRPASLNSPHTTSGHY